MYLELNNDDVESSKNRSLSYRASRNLLLLDLYQSQTIQLKFYRALTELRSLDENQSFTIPLKAI